MFTLEQLALTYPTTPPLQALRDVSFSIAPGSFTALVGPSGCGKSTLLQIIAGLLAPTSGTLRFDAPTRPRTAFVFQSPTLLPWRTVLQNIQLPLELGPNPPRPHSSDLTSLLQLTGLADFAHALPHQLSGGMQMRASLARALATSPELLLLDEPFGALDDLTRQRLNEELNMLWQRQRWTACFVTHNVAEAVFLSQRVIVFTPRPGRIAADFEIPFPADRTPALRATPAFAELTGRISAALLQAAA